MSFKRIRIVVHTVLCLTICAYFNLGMLSAKPLLAAVSQVERPEEELLILEVHVNEFLRNKGMIGYMPDPSDMTGTFLPLSSLSRALSFSIRANPADGIAEGWFRSEENRFYLDITRGVVITGGKEVSIPEGSVEVHFEDIYVSVAMLEEWLGITIRPDISLLRLYVTSDTPFPFEEEAARQDKYKRMKGGHADSASMEYDAKNFIPYGWWSLPSFVLQNTVTANSADSGNDMIGSFSVQSTGDALQMGTKFIIAGSGGASVDPDIDIANLTFEKSDPEGDMLGFMDAGKIAIGDVSFSEVPLAVGKKRGRGLSISSRSDYNFNQTFGAEEYNLDGDAPVGWDAELYRNGYFVAFQQIGADGRYNFENVELVRGYNMFQVVLYGPEGQKETRNQRVVRGADMRREGEFEYDFSIGQPDADFLPIAKNSRSHSDFGAGARVSYGVKEYLTLGANVFTGEDTRTDAQRQTSAGVSAVVATGPIKTQVQLMQANEGRNAYSVDTMTNIANTNVNAGHTVYNGFDEDDKDLLSTSGIGVNRSFGFMSLNANADISKFQKKDDETSIDLSVTTRLKGVQFNNQIARIYSDNEAQEKTTGNLAALTNIQKWRVRANLSYDLGERTDEHLRSLNVSAYRSLDKTSTLRLNTDYNFQSELKSADIRYSKQFEKFAIDVNAGANSQNTYFGGVTMRTGLMADHNGQYKFVSARNGGLGAVGLRAYVDENGNKLFDEGESVLKNLSFRSNRGMINGKTDEDGYLFINGLAEGPTRFALDKDSMPSIYIRPYDDYWDIVPRTGAVTTIDLGFEQLGEIDGFIYVGSKEKAATGVEMILIDTVSGKEVSSVMSEYDGYFVFSALPMGHYRIEALPVWGSGGAVPVKDVTLENAQPMVTDLEVILEGGGGKIWDAAQLDAMRGKGADDASSVVEPAAGDASAQVQPAQEGKIQHAVEDAPARVVTDGKDIATGEELRGVYIHVGSLSNLKTAQEEQKRLWEKYPDILGDIPLYIYEISVGEKLYFRIVGAVDDAAHGQTLCDEMKTTDSMGGCALMKL